MLHNTRGIVLRAVKYGDTSLICTVFTALFGVQAYMVQGVRTSKTKQNKAAFFQPATLLDMVVYHKPQSQLQRIREFQAAYIYTAMHEHIVKNSITLFSIELLLRLLPEGAPMMEVFDFSFDYFCVLDKEEVAAVPNFPLYFIVQISRHLGYELKGSYSEATPHLNLQDGGFTSSVPLAVPFVSDDDAAALALILKATDTASLKNIHLNSSARQRLLEWYLTFLHQYTQHLGAIKSLAILQAVMH
ncbi:MAG: DNA repair protein RecO [Taibaiella sp.]|nr:DNA repair protein RecO [Taibaiella sp.]